MSAKANPAKNLFTETKTNSSLRRSPIRRHYGPDPSPPSSLALLCGIVVVSVAIFSLPLLSIKGDSVRDQINTLVYRDIRLFFQSSGPFRNASTANCNPPDIIFFDFTLGAVPLAILGSAFLAACLGLCVYYDSAHPGVFPRSPCTPIQTRPQINRSASECRYSCRGLSLSYSMFWPNLPVFVVVMVAIFRIYFNLSLLY